MTRRAAASAALLLLAGCDWELYALTNGTPLDGDPAINPELHVYLGVDGLPAVVVEQAMADGLLDRRWTMARSISMFPSMSTASWAHILRGGVDGYEMAYYDPDADDVANDGLLGVASHALPYIDGASWPGDPVYGSFDHVANGYLDVPVSYVEPELSFGETLDNVFFLLDQQVELASDFSAYISEIDHLGHMRSRDAVQGALVMLLDRIDDFEAAHPERRVTFTLVSDHGMDDVEASADEFIDFPAEMARRGVAPVDSFAAGAAAGGLYAVPVLHTHQTFLALHTETDQVEAIAARLSRSSHVEAIAAVGARDPALELLVPGELAWATLWQDGEAVVRFAHDRGSDTYYVDRASRLDRLGIATPTGGRQGDYRVVDDEALFAAAASSPYPDLFYRLRTGLESISVAHPAQLLVAFRRPYTSAGEGTGNSLATHGFHGNLDLASSAGVVLTDERSLPPLVRSFSVLDLFPRWRRHLEETGVPVAPDDHGGTLDYAVEQAARSP